MMTYRNIDIIERYGLAHWRDAFVRLAQPSIQILLHSADEMTLSQGISKLGGLPDLPANYNWPRNNGKFLPFVAQIRLSEISLYDTTHILPKSGMIYFFYDFLVLPNGYDSEDFGEWRVIYHPNESEQFTRTNIPSELKDADSYGPAQLQVCRMTFLAKDTFPDWGANEIYQLFGRENLACYNNILDRIVERNLSIPREKQDNLHHIFGYPEPIQPVDMKKICQNVSENLYVHAQNFDVLSENWKLLLQLDSDEENTDMLWGDNGRIYFWIRQKDLESHSFGNVWLILQSH